MFALNCFFFFFPVLGIELRAYYVLVKHPIIIVYII